MDPEVCYCGRRASNGTATLTSDHHMANTRAKRAAESADPSAAAADPGKTRSSKRSKKAAADAPEPAQAAVPLAQTPLEAQAAKPVAEANSPMPVIETAIVDPPAPVAESSKAGEVLPSNDIIVDEEEEENQDAPELAEEVRASDLYLDTVSRLVFANGYHSTVSQRSIGPFSTSTLRKYVRYRL